MSKRYVETRDVGGTPAKLYLYSDIKEIIFSVNPEEIEPVSNTKKAHEFVVKRDGQGHYVDVPSPLMEAVLSGLLV